MKSYNTTCRKLDMGHYILVFTKFKRSNNSVDVLKLSMGIYGVFIRNNCFG